MSIPTRADLDAIVADRLSSDPTFRDQLISDPRTTLSALINIDIPESVEITVHEESLTDVHLVIPAGAAGEVGDADLELVSGGVCWADDEGVVNCV